MIRWFLAISILIAAAGANASDLAPLAVLSKVPSGTQVGKGKVILGALGQSREACKIYSKPDAHSDVYYSLKPGEYLVIKGFDADWSKVLLQNGMFGYALRAKVVRLPYEVTHGNEPGTPAYSGSIPYGKFIGAPISKSLRGGGLVRQILGTMGRKISADLDEQVAIGTSVNRLEDLKSGDRVYFWSKKRDEMDFAGIYLGKGYVIAPFPGSKTIATRYLGEKKLLDSLVAARR